MPQNDNNSKAVSQLTLNDRHKTSQNEPGVTWTLSPQRFQPEIIWLVIKISRCYSWQFTRQTPVMKGPI